MFFPGQLEGSVVWFLLLTIPILIKCNPHPNGTSVVSAGKNLRDDCLQVPVGDGYSDPCQSYLGTETYKWCPSTCDYSQCTCCQNQEDCPPTTDQDDCKFVPQVYDGSDPCISYFGGDTYKYCGSTCENDRCKCCRDRVGCPTIVWPDLALCKFVLEDGSSDPCLNHFGVDTYTLCANGCREDYCLCCEDGQGCPPQHVAKNDTFWMSGAVVKKLTVAKNSIDH